MKTIMLAAALAPLLGAAALALDPDHLSAARVASIRECVAGAAKTYPIKDSNWSIYYYRACMTQHSQPE